MQSSMFHAVITGLKHGLMSVPYDVITIIPNNNACRNKHTSLHCNNLFLTYSETSLIQTSLNSEFGIIWTTVFFLRITTLIITLLRAALARMMADTCKPHIKHQGHFKRDLKSKHSRSRKTYIFTFYGK
jgi:hypothetical protein